MRSSRAPIRGMLAEAMLSAVLLQVTPQRAVAHGDSAHATDKQPQRKEQVAWGIAGDAKSIGRSIGFVMSDAMRFTPDRLEVKQGETLRLVLRNDGKLRHEFVLGTKQELDEHAALMRRFPNMEHDEPYMAHVPPGRTAEIVWTFNRAGEFAFACLIDGHYQAGMVGSVKVIAAATTKVREK